MSEGCILRQEAGAGTPSTRRGRGCLNNFRYTDDSILMAESKEELNSVLMKVKEEREKAS